MYLWGNPQNLRNAYSAPKDSEPDGLYFLNSLFRVPKLFHLGVAGHDLRTGGVCILKRSIRNYLPPQGTRGPRWAHAGAAPARSRAGLKTAGQGISGVCARQWKFRTECRTVRQQLESREGVSLL